MKKFVLLFVYLCLPVYAYSLPDSLAAKLAGLKDNHEKVALLNQIAFDYHNINTDSGLVYANKALALAEKISDKYGTAEAFKTIGVNYWRKSHYDVALDSYYNSLKIYESLNYSSGIAAVNGNIGLIFMALEQNEKAKLYLYQSFKIYSSINDYKGMGRSASNLALVYSNTKDYQNAANYLQIGSNYYKAAGNIDGVYYNNSFLGLNYIKLHKYDSAFYYISAANSYFANSPKINSYAMSCNHFAIYYNEVKQYPKALEYARRGYSLGKNFNSVFMEIEAVEQIFMTYEQLKKFDSAYYYHKIFYQLADSLKNENNIKAIAQREVQYAYDKQMHEIEKKSLLEKERKEAIIRYIVFFLILSSIFSILLFILYKQKNRANKELAIKGEKIFNQKEELLDLNSKLNELNATKDKFFAIIAHDLKNPLGSFTTISELLISDYDTMTEADKKEFLFMLKDSAKNVYSLLENLLEWSRSQRGIIPFNPELVNLSRITSNVIQTCKQTANNKSIELTGNVADTVEVLADANMLVTVVRNLVTNAIKFTPESGCVKIEAELDSNTSMVVIKVLDNGVGMDDDTLQKIFKIDKTTTQPGTNNERGTGLGLILCKEFVEKHNGQIWVESKLNVGSTFFVALPINNWENYYRDFSLGRALG